MLLSVFFPMMMSLLAVFFPTTGLIPIIIGSCPDNLRIMRLPVDVVISLVQFLVKPGSLLGRQIAIRLHAALHSLDAGLLRFQSLGLARGNAAVVNPLLNTLLLILLPLLNPLIIGVLSLSRHRDKETAS